MSLQECKYRRRTTRPDFEQLHCALKKDNCSESECKKCKYVENESTPRSVSVENKRAWRHRKGTWMPNRSSRGLGDTIEKVTHRTGVAWIVTNVAEMFGIDCGCDKRREFLNKVFAYRE